jgi:hypothetical protein
MKLLKNYWYGYSRVSFKFQENNSSLKTQKEKSIQQGVLDIYF